MSNRHTPHTETPTRLLSTVTEATLASLSHDLLGNIAAFREGQLRAITRTNPALALAIVAVAERLDQNQEVHQLFTLGACFAIGALGREENTSQLEALLTPPVPTQSNKNSPY